MANFAYLRADNSVENFIVAETKEIAEELTGRTCIEYDDTQYIGLYTKYDSKKKVWYEDVPKEVPPVETP